VDELEEAYASNKYVEILHTEFLDKGNEYSLILADGKEICRISGY